MRRNLIKESIYTVSIFNALVSLCIMYYYVGFKTIKCYMESYQLTKMLVVFIIVIMNSYKNSI